MPEENLLSLRKQPVIINGFLAGAGTSGATLPSILGFGLLEDKHTQQPHGAVNNVSFMDDRPGKT